MTNVTPRTLTVRSTAIPEFMGAPALEPVRLTGDERLDHLFAYRLIVRTPETMNFIPGQGASFPLAGFVGQELTVTIELEGRGTFEAGAVGHATDAIGAGAREISGLITEARFLREEGRQALYQLTLRPWLHLATLTTDCRIFQDMTVVEILDTVLSDYHFPVEKRLAESYPARDYRTQWLETDYQFICRLCEEWGISFFFAHSEGKHRLVLADTMAAYHPNPSAAYQALRFYPPGHKIDEEYIHALVPGNALTSGAYATTEYDYTRPRADLRRRRTAPRPTGQADQEIFDWHARSHYAQPKAGPQQAPNDPFDEGDKIALLRAQALRTPGIFAQGAGHLRGMVPGHTFELARHPHEQANIEYVILGAHLDIEEIGAESHVPQTGAQGRRSQHFRVDAEFDLFPARNEQYRPEQRTPWPRVQGPQTAIVVGPENQNVWTDAFGRIKVQFPWDRYGGHDANSSCWVRVTSFSAGNQMGNTYVPRIGQEVIIGFLDGSPDLPICIGCVHNQLNLPSFRLPDYYALSGLRSRELTPGGGNASGGRSNHLLLDDTEAKIQAQLRSDHDASQLSLGHITRIEKNVGRQDYRGHGFELRSDGHGAVRARNGLLVTTEARTGASGHMLDSGETVQRLTEARDLHESLADTAQQAGAQDTGKDQSDVAAELKHQNDQIQGKGGASSARDSDAEGFPELAAPHLVLASPAGIETTTAGSTHMASEGHTAITSGRHTSLSSGGSFLASVKGAIRLFAHREGIRLISALEDIDLRALERNLRLLAKLDITMTANRITISAKDEVVVNGGGSYTKWAAGRIEHGTTGLVQYHCVTYNVLGARNRATPTLPESPKRKEDLLLSLGSFPRQGFPFVNEPYALYKGAALVGRGVTDANGRVPIKDHEPGTSAYTVRLTNGAEFQIKVSPTLDPRSAEQRLSNAGFRGAAGPASRADDYPSAT